MTKTVAVKKQINARIIPSSWFHSIEKKLLTLKQKDESYLIDEWYTAGEAGCDLEDGLCMATPDTKIRGKFNWMVIACVGDNCGISSDALPFSAGKSMSTLVQSRFSDFNDGTVLDNNTKLMWTKDASMPSDIYYMVGDLE